MSRTQGQLFNMPGAAYLGSVMCNMKFIWDLDAPTAYTDGKVVAFNPNFYLSMQSTTRVTVVAHEVWHPAYGHLHRRGNRCPDIWNQAADYVINNMLDSQGFSFDMPIMPNGEVMKPCLDHKYDNMTTEEVYDQLVAEGAKPFEMPDMSGTPMSGDIRELPGKPGSPERAAAVEDLITVMIQGQQAAQRSNQSGDIPGEVKLIIDSFLNPKIDWRRILRKYFTALSKDDYSWRRPSRRAEEYLPTLVGDNGLEHIIYYIDVSGSITDGQIKRFNSEVRSIHKSLKPELLTVVTFDTKLHDIYQFTKDQPFNTIEITGRGGTKLDCVYEHIVQNKPTAAVIFSDLYVKPMKVDPGVPIMWVVMDNQTASTNFGRMIHLDKEDLD